MNPSIAAFHASGFDFHVVRSMNPRLEKDTFSGGVNETRRARNRERIREATATIYRMGSAFFGSTYAIAAVRAAVEKAGLVEGIPRLPRLPVPDYNPAHDIGALKYLPVGWRTFAR